MYKLLAPALAFFLVASALAETTPSLALRETILRQDKALFDAFNVCDLENWNRSLSEDIEFYQDNDDVTTGRAPLERFFRDRCGEGTTPRMRRELVDPVEVHPIQGYGAVQFGTHRFFIVQEGVPDKLVATPKLVHLWRLQDGAWQITRVISYDH